MIQQFYKNTIESNFIKALLSNFNFPIYKSVNDDNDYIIKDCQYIYRNKVILCTKTGNINKDAEFEKVADYHMGQKYTGMTYPYISTERYYDYETHYYLGRYLRLVRDLLDIDLMPFYNCFSNRIVSDFYLTSDGYEFGYNPKYTVYLVPIELNTEYTIAIESAESVYLKPVFYNEMGMIPMYATSGYMTDLLNASTIVKQSLRFNAPFNITIKSDNKLCERNYKNLYLAIQVPMNTKSSIVVLEGSYNEFANNSLKVINQEAFKSDNFSIDDHQLNKILLSDLQLLNLNDGKSYPFSDRLMEYLLLNVITSDDAIDRNIVRTQLYISDTSKKRNIGLPSVNIEENYDKVYYIDSISSENTEMLPPFNRTFVKVHTFSANIDVNKDYLLDFMGYRVVVKFDKLKVAIPTESGYVEDDTGLYYCGLVRYKDNYYEQSVNELPDNVAALSKFGLLVDGNVINLYLSSDVPTTIRPFTMYEINYGEPVIKEVPNKIHSGDLVSNLNPVGILDGDTVYEHYVAPAIDAAIDVSKSYRIDFEGYTATFKFKKLVITVGTPTGNVEEDTGLYYYGLVKYKGKFYGQSYTNLPKNGASLKQFGLLVEEGDNYPIAYFTSEISMSSITEKPIDFTIYEINTEKVYELDTKESIVEGKPLYTLPKFLGSWSPKIRYALYNIYMNNSENPLDINGFVDKCMEKLITKGFDV